MLSVNSTAYFLLKFVKPVLCSKVDQTYKNVLIIITQNE